MRKEFFENNRKKLFAKLSKGDLVILCAGNLVTKSEDEAFDWSPNRNFYYMSGIDEADDVVVFYKGERTTKVFGFITRFDETKAKWVGRTYTAEECESKGGIKKFYYLDQMEKVLDKFVKENKISHVYFDFNNYKDREYCPNYLYIKKHFPKLLKGSKDIYETIGMMRLVKEKEEIEMIKKAIHITNNALTKVIKNVSPKAKENDLDCLFKYEILKNGASDLAFKTIAASGLHSCTLHYNTNKDTLPSKGVILFDLGAEFDYYKADISRTVSINKKFTKKEQTYYDIVRQAQEIVFKNAKPGVTIMDLQKLVVEHYEKALAKIGLIKSKEEVRNYYYHSVSHPLGLDTHDVCSLATRTYPLEAGWVITVEPGLYVAKDKIGIRIEDDILITKNGCEVLSKEIAK